MALSIYLENGKIVVKSLATVNAAYDPAYFSPIQAKQYPTEGFLTATRVGTTNNLSITDANGKYIVYDLPYTEFKQKNGTTNIGSTVLTTVSTLNGTSYFGFDVDFNSSISGIDTRVGGAETTLTDVGKALRYDKNNGADPRGIYYDDLKSENDSFVTVESAKATIQGGITTNVTVEELNGISYFKFNALDTAGAYSMITVTGKNQAGTLDLNNGTLLKFDNGTNNVSIGISSLTGNRSLFLPDASGTIALTSDIVTDLGYVDFEIASPPSLSNGRLAYDVDRETLVFQSEHGELAIGEIYKPVINNSGANIPAGSVVKAVGVNGERFQIQLFDATTDEELYLIGVTQSALANGDEGIVVTQGIVKHIDTSMWAVGTILYVDTLNPGGLENIPPTSPDLAIPVAMVMKQDATNGTLFVRPTIYAHLNELHDVKIVTPSNDSILVYDDVQKIWYNNTIVGIGAVTSVNSVNPSLGNVTLDTDDISEGSTNAYYTDAKVDARIAAVVNEVAPVVSETASIVLEDNTYDNKFIVINSGTSVDVEMEGHAIYNGWEAGTEFYFMQGGVGEINLVSLGPVFKYPSDKSLMTRTQNSVIGMKCIVAPTPTTPGYWVVFGDLKDA